MNPSEQVDLLDLELSHEAEDDVSKPVSNDGMQLFNYDHETQPMLGTKSTESLEMGSMSSMGNNLNQTPTSKTGEPIDPNAKCWSIQYYQPWFDIDTNQELHRLKKSLLPFLASNFFDKELDEKPDLLRYVPFNALNPLSTWTKSENSCRVHDGLKCLHFCANSKCWTVHIL